MTKCCLTLDKMSHFFTVPEPFCDPKNALKAFAAGPRLRRSPRPSSRLGRGIPPPHTLSPRPLRRLDPRVFSARHSAPLFVPPHKKSCWRLGPPPPLFFWQIEHWVHPYQAVF